MEKNIQKLLDEIEQMKNTRSLLLAKQKKHYEHYKNTTAKIEILESKLEQAKSLTIPVRLGYLLEELAKLTGSNLDEINVKLFFDSWHINEIFIETRKKIMEITGNGVCFKISDNYGKFTYEGVTKPHTKEEILELFGHTSGQIKKLWGFYLIPIYIDVEDITLRHTVIRTVDNKRVIIPNGRMDEITIENYNHTDNEVCRFVEYPIAYTADVDKAMNILKEEINKFITFNFTKK